MLKKRIKKEYPPGTFLPTPIRIIVITQLCLTFSLFLWLASQPFMGDLFRVKSEMLLYHDVMGISPPNREIPPEKQMRLERNANRFEQLPADLKQNINSHYIDLQEELNRSFTQKIHALINIFTHQTSIFELGWIFFASTISILLLKKTEGAQAAAWLLPAITLCFLLEAQTQKSPSPSPNPYPSEQEIVQNYLNKPLSNNMLEQKEQLLEGWNLYLIKNWSDSSPSKDKATFLKQAEQGEFMFNVTRLQTKHTSLPPRSQSPQPFLFLCIYVFWNLFFAYKCNCNSRDCG